jgi:hypothetical protein
MKLKTLAGALSLAMTIFGLNATGAFADIPTVTGVHGIFKSFDGLEIVNFAVVVSATPDSHGNYDILSGNAKYNGTPMTLVPAPVPGQITFFKDGAALQAFAPGSTSVPFVPTDIADVAWQNATSSTTLGTLPNGDLYVVHNDQGVPGPVNYGLLKEWLGPVTGGVPEPSTWAMMLVGLGGLGALIRQRRRSFVPVVA